MNNKVFISFLLITCNLMSYDLFDPCNPDNLYRRINALESKILELSDKFDKHSSISKIEDTKKTNSIISKTSVFYACNKTRQVINNADESLVFNDFQASESNGWKYSNGMFTSPDKGVYLISYEIKFYIAIYEKYYGSLLNGIIDFKFLAKYSSVLWEWEEFEDREERESRERLESDSVYVPGPKCFTLSNSFITQGAINNNFKISVFGPFPLTIEEVSFTATLIG